MRSANRPITSREYKLILKVDQFGNLKKGSKDFWDMVKSLVKDQGGKDVEEQGDVKTRRTWYRDTPEYDLRNNGFVLRLREESDEAEKYKITLKYRSPDRYLSAGQSIKTNGGERKFEEDIIRGFVSKFSNSVSVRKNKLPKLNNMGKVVKLFSGLEVPGILVDTPIETVSHGFEAHEMVIWLGQFRFGSKPKVKVCLSFWYPHAEEAGDDETPLIGEFSFDYDIPKKELPKKNGLEKYPIKVVDGAKRLFTVLQEQSDWIDLCGTTKTAYAYTHAEREDSE
ncbi:hypothetical protein ACFL6S_09755 [Candidatus Poribacteria bacterium]